MEKQEKNKPIPENPGYFATNDGQIYSLKTNKSLKKWQNHRGYELVKLSVNGKTKTHLVHRLIAAAFLGPSDLSVDHVNFVKNDNRLENLRYVSAKENHRMAVENGRIKKGENHHASKYSDQDVMKMMELARIGWSQQRIAQKFGGCQSMVSRAIRGRNV